MAVTFGVLAWLAWEPSRVRRLPSRRERVLSLLPNAAVVVFGTVEFLRGHPGPSSIAFVGVLAVASVAVGLVLRRAQLAAIGGVPLEGGMASAYGAVRWATLVLAVVAGAVGASSAVAMIALGHSCTNGFPG